MTVATTKKENIFDRRGDSTNSNIKGLPFIGASPSESLLVLRGCGTQKLQLPNFQELKFRPRAWNVGIAREPRAGDCARPPRAHTGTGGDVFEREMGRSPLEHAPPHASKSASLSKQSRRGHRENSVRIRGDATTIRALALLLFALLSNSHL